MPHVWADAELASSILSRIGVRDNRPVLNYTSLNPMLPTGDDVPQGILAYSLERYGLRDILILNGGLEEWRRAGGRI
jgi:thiosulfate/3-mercaptopyruvate sulfurtransferase